MKLPDLVEVQLGNGRGRGFFVLLAAGCKVMHLGEPVNDDEDSVMARLGLGEASHKFY
jgi:hypothetical protein